MVQQAAPTLVYDGHFPVGYPTPVPIIYNMNDYANRDWSEVDPDYGPMGGWANWSWHRIHHGPGQFDWRPIDSYIEAASRIEVTLRDGTVIPKPIAISVQVFPEPGYDNTPEWIYAQIPGSPRLDGRLVGQVIDPDGKGPCPPEAGPAWANPVWRDYFDEMVLAMGERYNNDPRVNSVWIATGMYGETVTEKILYPNCPTYVFSNGFGQWVVNRVLPIYREAFPEKPLYLINTGGGCLRKDSSAVASQFPVRIGLKHNSLTYDVRGEMDILGCGKMETMNPYTVTTPIAFEHAFASYPWQVYWSTMNGLAHHADLFDFPYTEGEWDILDTLSEMKDMLHGYDQWEFVDRYLGRTLNDSPGVWIMFRDTQWTQDYGLWSGGGTCLPYQRWAWGEQGRDWAFWMYRQDAWQGRALPVTQAPGTFDRRECATEYPNRFSRYQALPQSVRPQKSDFPWSYDDETIRQDILDKTYGHYGCRQTNEPTDPYFFLDVDNRWAYWRNLPRSEPDGTAIYTTTVIYLDQGYDTWKFSYTNYYGIERERIVRKNNTKKWKAQTWRFLDMYLSDGLTNTVDIVLNSNGDGDEYFHLVLVEAEGKAEPAPTPAPTIAPDMAEQRVDDLQERTGAVDRTLEEIRRILEQLGDIR
jgi:hypothetical protein